MVTRTKKIFVGGLSANTVVEDLKAYFGTYGKVNTRIFFFEFISQRAELKYLVKNQRSARF